MSPKQKAFLAVFRETGNVRLACTAAKVSRSRHYQWLDEDPEYRKAVDLAKEDAADVLEEAAWRRAVEGVEKPTGWYKGKPGGWVPDYSDGLLKLLLKGLRPEKYSERQEVTVTSPLAGLVMEKLPHDLIQRIAAGEPVAAVLLSATRAQLEAARIPEGECEEIDNTGNA